MSSAATEAPAATEPPAAEAPLQTAPILGTPAPTFEDRNSLLGTATPDAASKAIAPAQPEPAKAPIPPVWQIVLLVIALLSGGLAWYLRRASERSWRAKTK
ncbi:MAG TPA: hypothetical protein VIV15_13645, partial [Anaerolineales bacterium]